MTIERQRIRSVDFLFYVAFGVFLIFGILSMSFYYKYFISFYGVIQLCCVALLLIREFAIDRYNIRTLIIAVVFVLLMVLIRIESSYSNIIYILTFLFCARDIDFHRLARFSFWVSLITLAVVVGSCYLGIIDDYIFSQSSDGRLRHCLGFRYTLYGPTLMFNLTALYVCIMKERIRWISLLILFFLNFYFFSMTSSRMAFGMSALLLLVSAFLKIRPLFLVKKRVLCYVLICSFVICFLISLGLTLMYDSSIPWMKQLDTLFETRFSLGKDSLMENGVTLFGMRMDMVGSGLDAYGQTITDSSYNYVDSLYLQVMQRYGIVLLVLWVGLLTYTLYRYYKKKDQWMLVCLAFIAVQCIVDDLTMEIYFNTFWFATAIVLQRSCNKRNLPLVMEPENRLIEDSRIYQSNFYLDTGEWNHYQQKVDKSGAGDRKKLSDENGKESL